MKPLLLSKHVDVPVNQVFAAASDFANAAGRIRGITKMEVLTPGPVGVGTKFRETRKMFGKEATEEMEVTVFEPDRSYELRSLSCGAEFRFLFHFVPEGTGTRMDVEFRTQAVTFLAKLMSPLAWLMKGMMRKCIEQDMDDIAAAASAGV